MVQHNLFLGEASGGEVEGGLTKQEQFLYRTGEYAAVFLNAPPLFGGRGYEFSVNVTFQHTGENYQIRTFNRLIKQNKPPQSAEA